MLCAKDGETVYMIIAQADEQTLYALGVDAETNDAIQAPARRAGACFI